MSARWRKLIGTGVLLGFMAFWIWAAVTVAQFIPGAWWAQLPYYVVAGTAWVFPLKPLFGWMNRGG